MQKPTIGLSGAHSRLATDDAGPLDGNPATSSRGAAPAADARRALSHLGRTLRFAPRPENAVRRDGARPVRDGARPVRDGARKLRRPAFRGPVPGQLSLFDPRPLAIRAVLSGAFDTIRRQDRSVAILVAAIVLIATATATIPAVGAAGPQGGTDGPGNAPRLVAGAALGGIGDGSGPTGAGDTTAGPGSGTGAAAVEAATPNQRLLAVGEPGPSAAPQGAFLPDGTLLKPIAVDTQVPAAGRDGVRKYTVRPGDTLTGIAHRFGVKMMTVWWANHLKHKDELKPGFVLVIPPNDGLLVTVKEGDSLAGIARRFDIPATQIQSQNQLPNDTVYIGQLLFVPNAQGAPIATPRPVPQIASVAGGGSVSRPVGNTGPTGPVRYDGGRLDWPVDGGGNYISQYFHYGHPALDIAAEYGTPVVAAAGGTVIFAGWRSNGGGYQVWISHGSNLFTTYNHMSAVSVGAGQVVGAGQRVGSIGQSGNATGPHLHFEVWVGEVWGGGYRVNPLAYLR